MKHDPRAFGATRPLEFGRKDGGSGGGTTEPAPRDEKTIQTELAQALGEVKRFAEEANTKLSANEALSKEAKADADKVLVKLAELRAEMTELHQRDNRRGKDGEAAQKSLGYAVAESEQVAAFSKGGAVGTIKLDRKAITSAAGSAGGLITVDRQQEVTGLPRREVRVRDLLMPGRTNSSSIEYPRQTTRTNNAAPVAEGGTKPESAYGWEIATANVRTVAHWVPVSRQAMDDAPQLASLIDGELRYGLDLVEDAQLLTGDGTGQNLPGLIPAATAYNPPAAAAAALAAMTAGETSIDRLRLGLLQVELADYAADGMVLNPIDWAIIELTKTEDGAYVFANPTGQAGPTLWGRPVVSTTAITVDKFLVGAFKAAAQIFDREDTEVLISSEDRDNFIKNMLTVRAEKRLALAVKRPTALVYGDFGRV
jgi:HK97 family phage major capsid protein